MSTLASDPYPTCSRSSVHSSNASTSTLQPHSMDFFPSQPYAQQPIRSASPTYLEGSATAQSFQYQQVGPIPSHLQTSEEFRYESRFEHFPQPSPQDDLDKLLRLRDEIESGRHPDFPVAFPRVENSGFGVDSTYGFDARMKKGKQGLPEEDAHPFYDEDIASQLPLLPFPGLGTNHSPSTVLTPGAGSVPISQPKSSDSVSDSASSSPTTAVPLEMARLSKDRLATGLQAKKELERREEELRQRIKRGSPALRSRGAENLPSESHTLKISGRSDVKTLEEEPGAKRQKRGTRGVPSTELSKDISPILNKSEDLIVETIVGTAPAATAELLARTGESIAIDDELLISSKPTLDTPSKARSMDNPSKARSMKSKSLPSKVALPIPSRPVKQMLPRGSSPQEALQITPAVPAIKPAPFIPLKVVAGTDDRWAATKSSATKASATSKSSSLERARSTPRSEDRWAKPARPVPERKVESRLEDRRGGPLSPMYRPLSTDFDDRRERLRSRSPPILRQAPPSSDRFAAQSQPRPRDRFSPPPIRDEQYGRSFSREPAGPPPFRDDRYPLQPRFESYGMDRDSRDFRGPMDDRPSYGNRPLYDDRPLYEDRPPFDDYPRGSDYQRSPLHHGDRRWSPELMRGGRGAPPPDFYQSESSRLWTDDFDRARPPSDSSIRRDVEMNSRGPPPSSHLYPDREREPMNHDNRDFFDPYFAPTRAFLPPPLPPPGRNYPYSGGPMQGDPSYNNARSEYDLHEPYYDARRPSYPEPTRSPYFPPNVPSHDYGQGPSYPPPKFSNGRAPEGARPPPPPFRESGAHDRFASAPVDYHTIVRKVSTGRGGGVAGRGKKDQLGGKFRKV